MKLMPYLSVRLLTSAMALVASVQVVVAAALSDLHPPARRQPVVAMATRLAQQTIPSSLPSDLKTPFNPPGFEQADPDEVKPVAPVIEQGPKLPAGDKELLNLLADQKSPSGTIQMNGEYYLLLDRKKYRVGDTVTFIYDPKGDTRSEAHTEYKVEISAIDRNSYSLRLKRAEITRPIQIGKKP